MEEKNISDGVERGVQYLGKKNDYFLPVSILIAGIMISGSVIYLVQKTPKNGISGGSPTAVVANTPAQVAAVNDRDVILGDSKAPVTIIEYGDYQCPFCEKFFSETEPLVREKYINAGTVRMIYRNFAFLGPESINAAEASECAKDQKKFWAYHDEIYKKEKIDGSENNGNLNRELFLTIAKDIGLDAEAFKSCIDSKKYTSVVQAEVTDGKNAGVDSTPYFFINGQVMRGALPYEGASGFKAVIDSALKAKFN
ncbi:MAG: DsbA family protein [Patescibacteria group bacterium]